MYSIKVLPRLYAFFRLHGPICTLAKVLAIKECRNDVEKPRPIKDEGKLNKKRTMLPSESHCWKLPLLFVWKGRHRRLIVMTTTRQPATRWTMQSKLDGLGHLKGAIKHSKRSIVDFPQHQQSNVVIEEFEGQGWLLGAWVSCRTEDHAARRWRKVKHCAEPHHTEQQSTYFNRDYNSKQDVRLDDKALLSVGKASAGNCQTTTHLHAQCTEVAARNRTQQQTNNNINPKQHRLTNDYGMSMVGKRRR